jgi:hypothetical protein
MPKLKMVRKQSIRCQDPVLRPPPTPFWSWPIHPMMMYLADLLLLDLLL